MTKEFTTIFYITTEVHNNIPLHRQLWLLKWGDKYLVTIELWQLSVHVVVAHAYRLHLYFWLKTQLTCSSTMSLTVFCLLGFLQVGESLQSCAHEKQSSLLVSQQLNIIMS